MRTIGKTLVLAMAVSGIAAFSGAQTARKPGFEVASIKPTTIRSPVNTPPGGMYVAVGQSLYALVQYAYRVRSYQVLGGPGWASTDLWEIQARAPKGSVQPRPNPDTADFDSMERMLSQPDTIALMLQSLLENRFQLKVHPETRKICFYELSVAKGGLKMELAADQTRPQQRPFGVFPRQLSGELSRGTMLMSRGVIEGRAIPFWMLLNSIRNQLDRPLINKMGLKGL